MSENVIRIGYDFLNIDIIKTPVGNIRIGSCPKVSKFLKENNIEANYVIVPPFIANYAGDNYTGEEFVLWNKIYKNDWTPNIYIGSRKNLNYLYKRLAKTINWTFNKDKTKIIKKNRLKKLFKRIKARYDKPVRIKKQVEIIFKPHDILIYLNSQKIYSWAENLNCSDINKKIISISKKYLPNKYIDYLEIIPLGDGNGFRGNTASFIVKYAQRIIFIDPIAEPLIVLKKLNLNFDNITDYFISHIHEDHIEGLSAILKFASDFGKKLNIITTKKIYKELKKIYEPLFLDFEVITNHINIIPNATLPYYHGYITVRLNHHVLKSQTLSFKIHYKNNIFAISGDTKYDSKLALKLKNNLAFDIGYYNDCHLLFHEVEFQNPNNVHTFYKEVEKIKANTKAKVLVYHSSSEKFLLDKVKEFHRYIIKYGKVILKSL